MHALVQVVPFLFELAAFWIVLALVLMGVKAVFGNKSLGWQLTGFAAYLVFWLALTGLAFLSVGTLVFTYGFGVK